MKRPNISLYESVGQNIGNIQGSFAMVSAMDTAQRAIARKKMIEQQNFEKLLNTIGTVLDLSTYVASNVQENKELERNIKSLKERKITRNGVEIPEYDVDVDYGFLGWKKFLGTPDVDVGKHLQEGGYKRFKLTEDQLDLLNLMIKRKKMLDETGVIFEELNLLEDL